MTGGAVIAAFYELDLYARIVKEICQFSDACGAAFDSQGNRIDNFMFFNNLIMIFQLDLQ